MVRGRPRPSLKTVVSSGNSSALTIYSFHKSFGGEIRRPGCLRKEPEQNASQHVLAGELMRSATRGGRPGFPSADSQTHVARWPIGGTDPAGSPRPKLSFSPG